MHKQWKYTNNDSILKMRRLLTGIEGATFLNCPLERHLALADPWIMKFPLQAYVMIFPTPHDCWLVLGMIITKGVSVTGLWHRIGGRVAKIKYRIFRLIKRPLKCKNPPLKIGVVLYNRYKSHILIFT